MTAAMPLRSRLIAVAAGALLLAGAVILVARGVPGQGDTHPDGEGDLAHTLIPQSWSAEVVHPKGPADTDFTFGIDLCDQTGAGPIVLDTVTPTAVLGEGAELLGARTWRLPTSDGGVLEWPGFPPSILSGTTLRDASGSAVTDRCSTDARTELLIGLRIKGAAGGGWRGVSIHYHVGGRARTLLANEYLVLCGQTLTCGPDTIKPDMPAASPPPVVR
jgi:hypothetical protein